MNQTEALMLINAYRMGVVPSLHHMDHLNRDKLTQVFDTFLLTLKEASTDTLLLKGAYGTGKTHSLEQFKVYATGKGYVVGRLVIDQNLKLYKLDDVYHEIMHNLYIDGQSHPASFEDLFDIWIDNLRHAPDKLLASHQIKYVIDELNRHHDAFSRAFMAYIRASLVHDTEKARDIAAWLKGDKTLPAQTKKDFGVIHTVDKGMALHFLKAFSALVLLLGYKGLVVMIDEADLIRTMRSDLRQASYATLRELIDLMYGQSLSTFGLLIAGTPEFYEDGDQGIPSYAPLKERLNLDHLSKRDKFFNLNHIDLKDIYTISDEIMHLYQVAYQEMALPQPGHACHLTLMDLKKQGLKFTDIHIRTYLQHYLSLLDDMRKHPHNKLYHMTMTLDISPSGDMLFKNRI